MYSSVTTDDIYRNVERCSTSVVLSEALRVTSVPEPYVTVERRRRGTIPQSLSGDGGFKDHCARPIALRLRQKQNGPEIVGLDSTVSGIAEDLGFGHPESFCFVY